MTGNELVKKAVLFQKPERIPRELPEPWGSDFLCIDADYNPRWKTVIPGEDEWGCVWEKDPENRTQGQVILNPVKDYSIFENYKFPDFKSVQRYEQAKKQIAGSKDNKFILASIPLSLIHRLEYLRGHIEAWTDPYEHPEELERLLDKLTGIAIDSIDRFAELGVNGIFSYDDWGLQDRPIFSPEIFRKFFKPRYAKVYKHAHTKGMLTFLHSCGYITGLLEDFIDAGLQVIQLDQQENMGVENLSKNFGGRICFWCPVDIQQTMINGSIEAVRTYARNLIESFGKFNGGFIAKWYSDPEAVGHTKENITAMAETFVKYGKY